jgi:DNA-binding response OmpR family regulator
MANIVLSGLEAAAQADLCRVLDGEGHRVMLRENSDWAEVDAVFCNGDSPDYPALLRRVRDLRPDLPVVVVTRLPESDKWLNALEAGAADYCSAPFEVIQVRWILSSVLGRGLKRAAA